MGRDGADTGGYLAAVVASLLTTALALAIPRIASQVVGGTLENLIAVGYQSARRIHQDVTSYRVTRAIHGVVGAPWRRSDGGVWSDRLPLGAASGLGSSNASGVGPRETELPSSSGAHSSIASNPPGPAPSKVATGPLGNADGSKAGPRGSKPSHSSQPEPRDDFTARKRT